jgi:hypothetical protein
MTLLVSGIRERHFMLGKEPEKIYALMLKTVLHAIDQTHFSDVETNPVLTALTGDVRTLIISINSILRRRVAETSLYLKTAIDILEDMKNSEEPLYIILCDALSLPEYMFLLYVFHESVAIDKALCAVNPSGKTATFKYLAKEYLGLKRLPPLEEATMKNISESLRRKLGASGATLFQDFDMLIHYRGEYRNADEMIMSLFKTMNKLQKEVEKHLNNEYTVLLLADHGYDVRKRGNLWTLTHQWDKEKLCVSPFVPILIME